MNGFGGESNHREPSTRATGTGVKIDPSGQRSQATACSLFAGSLPAVGGGSGFPSAW